MPNPHDYFNSFAEELAAKFQRIGHLVANKAATGTYHEEILRVVLRNFLSKRFSVKTGFVYKNELECSRQVDILIVDEYDAGAYIYQEGDFAIVRPRSAVAVIEVKSRLDGSSLGEALENVASVKALTADPHAICGMIFGYGSPNPGPRNLHSWFKLSKAGALADNPALGPVLISFFQRGVLLMKLDFEHGATIDEASPHYHPVVHISKAGAVLDGEIAGEGWQLRHMLAMIYSACARREILQAHSPPDQSEVTELLQLSGAVPSGDHVEFGTGFVSRS